MDKHPFLSGDWITTARGIQAEFERRAEAESASQIPIRVNGNVTEVPFGTEVLECHVDTREGILKIDLGHLPEPDATVTVPYGIAKSMLVFADRQVGIQAYMVGRVKVAGDVSKLMLLQGGLLDPIVEEARQRLADITE